MGLSLFKNASAGPKATGPQKVNHGDRKIPSGSRTASPLYLYCLKMESSPERRKFLAWVIVIYLIPADQHFAHTTKPFGLASAPFNSKQLHTSSFNLLPIPKGLRQHARKPLRIWRSSSPVHRPTSPARLLLEKSSSQLDHRRTRYGTSVFGATERIRST